LPPPPSSEELLPPLQQPLALQGQAQLELQALVARPSRQERARALTRAALLLAASQQPYQPASELHAPRVLAPVPQAQEQA
jgi:hypothetical protein